MKKFTSIFAFVLTIAVCITAFSACDVGLKRKEPTADSYFNFTLLDDDTYMIAAKDLNDLPATVVLPSEHEGKAVTTIADSAFEESKIERIFIPESYTKIGAYAFVRCSLLKTVEFSVKKNIKTIDTGAFSYCVSLKGIEFFSSLEVIGARAFIVCTSLSSVYVTANVREIGEKAFDDCTCTIDVSENNKYYKSENNQIVAK